MKDMLWKDIGDGFVILDIRHGLPDDNEVQYVVVLDSEHDVFVVRENDKKVKEIQMGDYDALFKYLGELVGNNSMV